MTTVWQTYTLEKTLKEAKDDPTKITATSHLWDFDGPLLTVLKA